MAPQTRFSPSRDSLPRESSNRQESPARVCFDWLHQLQSCLTMPACTYCKDKHMKCDKRLPRCSQCVRANVKCTTVNRTSSPVRTNRLFEKNQTWLPVPPQVDFIFEDTVEVETPLTRASTLQHGMNQRDERSVQEQDLPILSPYGPAQSPRPAVSPLDPELHSYHSKNTLLISSSVDRDLAISYRSGFINSEEDAFLFRYFIDNVSGLFDVADSSCHFAREVPQRARTNGTLFNAMLAISAKHASSSSLHGTHDSDSYLQLSLQSLIPALNDHNAVADEAFFAAVVLLRSLEEMYVPLVGSDPQNHRLGTQAIVSASNFKSSGSLHGLRRACYWTAFRQEFLISLRTQKPTQWKVPENVGISEPAHDDIWALRAVQQCGKVVDLVFDEHRLLQPSEYAVLMEEIEAWQCDRPASFDALFVTVSRENSQEFPYIHLHTECHVMGHQYNVLAHSLLTSYMPLRRISLSRRSGIHQIDETLRSDVRKLCGVAKGNKKGCGASLVACMAIELFGDRFSNPQETRQLHAMLTDTEKAHAWPTHQTAEALERLWRET